MAYDSRRAWWNTRCAKLAESLTERALQDAFNLILIGNYKERVIGGMSNSLCVPCAWSKDRFAEMLNLLSQYASTWTGTCNSITCPSSAPLSH